jgi:hypothetical protein
MAICEEDMAKMRKAKLRKAKMRKAKMLFGLRKGGKGCRDWQAEQNRDEVRRQTEVPDHPGIYVYFSELLDTSR